MSSKRQIEAKAVEVGARYGTSEVGKAVDPVRIAATQEIRIYNAVFDSDKTEGMISRRGGRTQIYVNSSKHPVRKRFTIAHELGHFFLHMIGEDGDFIDTGDSFRSVYEPDFQWTDNRRKEWEANTFAAALLMPEASVKYLWNIRPSLEFVCRTLEVSHQSASIRLEDLGISFTDD